jgi:hypothetical protein
MLGGQCLGSLVFLNYNLHICHILVNDSEKIKSAHFIVLTEGGGVSIFRSNNPYIRQIRYHQTRLSAVLDGGN